MPIASIVLYFSETMSTLDRAQEWDLYQELLYNMDMKYVDPLNPKRKFSGKLRWWGGKLQVHNDYKDKKGMHKWLLPNFQG